MQNGNEACTESAHEGKAFNESNEKSNPDPNADESIALVDTAESVALKQPPQSNGDSIVSK